MARMAKKALIAFTMILMTATAGQAGGIVSKHASSVQLTVDAAKSVSTRTVLPLASLVQT